MTIIEKFTSFDQFNEHYRSIMNDLLPVDEHIYYLLFQSKQFLPLDVSDVLRDYYRNPSPAEYNIIVQLCRTTYLRSVQQYGEDPIVRTDEEIDASLGFMMNGDDVHASAYPMYVFPWPRAKFIQKFYGNVFPSAVRDYTQLLSESGHFLFKKTFTMVRDMPFSDQLREQLLTDSMALVRQVDFSQIFSDLQENLEFYREQYLRAQQQVHELQRTIDQMSEQVQTQSLTRWY